MPRAQAQAAGRQTANDPKDRPLSAKSDDEQPCETALDAPFRKGRRRTTARRAPNDLRGYGVAARGCQRIRQPRRSLLTPLQSRRSTPGRRRTTGEDTGRPSATVTGYLDRKVDRPLPRKEPNDLARRPTNDLRKYGTAKRGCQRRYRDRDAYIPPLSRGETTGNNSRRDTPRPADIEAKKPAVTAAKEA